MLRAGADLPAADEVEDLYALASTSATPPEPPEVAAMYAALYDLSLDRSDLIAVSAREVGELVGFGYGHRWFWGEQHDEWSAELSERLGDSAGLIEGGFVVALLAVHPHFTRAGLGFELLKRIMVASCAAVHWLQTTDVDSPASRLFTRMGYRRLGHGPQASDGRPGRVLRHG